MNILHIIPALLKGGAERLAIDICTELATRQNVRSKLVSFSEKNEYKYLTDKAGLVISNTTFIPSITRGNVINADKLQAIIKEYQPSIIHLHLFESVFVLSQLAIYGAKVVVHFHDNMIQFQKLSYRSPWKKSSITNYYEKRIVLQRFSSKNTSFIAISKNTLNFIKKNVPSKYPVSLLHNAINSNRFKIVKNKEVGSNRIVMIGSFVPKKGHILALETIVELKNRNINIHLDLLGDGMLKHKIEKFISDNNLSDQVTLHGNVDYPENYLWKSFCYLHTAHYEPFGLVILEAMAAQLPVVCTDGGGNKDLIEEGKNGFLMKNRSAAALADKIEILFHNDSLRKKMGENAQEFALKYDIKQYTDNLINIYKDSMLSAKTE